jgi:hypothetical protein
MANPNPKTEHLEVTRWQAGQSGNPAGKPKGTKNLSSWIREMLEDESFTQKLKNGKTVKGAPVQAVVKTLIEKAIQGDMKAFDLLARYGYGTKVDVTAVSTNVNLSTDLSEMTDEELNSRLAELRQSHGY